MSIWKEIKAQLYAYRSSDSTFQPARLDKATNSLQIIDYAHHEVHAGSAFEVNHIVDVANGASVDLLITTPDTTKWAHLTVGITTESEVHAYLYENPTISGAGTGLTEYNHNRNSATAATTTVEHTPSVGAVGTTIVWEGHWGSGRGIGGNAREVAEFILKQNEQYLLRVTNATANPNQTWIQLDWYEHTDIA